MSNYKDTMAYKLYRKAEENSETGKAVENLVEKILKEVCRTVDFGGKLVWFEPYEYTAKIRDGAISELRGMGFKVTPSEYRKSELYILWDFSEEDAEEEDSNANES